MSDYPEPSTVHEYTDSELFILEPLCILHDAARADPDGCVAHAVPHPDGTDDLVVALHFEDKDQAKRVFDALHEVTGGLVPSWAEHVERRKLAEGLAGSRSRAKVSA